MRSFTTFDEISAAAGEPLGSTDWVEVTQDRVDAFADATGDHQWIHVDVERAKDGPFGGTIAHGYLTLSLVPWLGSQIFALETPGAKLNYGLNKVRFPHPLLVGKRIRCAAVFSDVARSRPACRSRSRTPSRSRARPSPHASPRPSSSCSTAEAESAHLRRDGARLGVGFRRSGRG